MIRNIMMMAVCILVMQLAYAQQHATGVVFVDQNQNGHRDRGEQGLPGVSVSNGVEVVLTDAQGRYRLPVGDDNIIFVIKPRDYAVPTTADKLPAFYYIHKPQGSPKLEFPGVAPTGPLPGQIDFPLVPSPEEDEFSVLVFGDPQPTDLDDLDAFAKAIIGEVEGIRGPQFGLVLGDLVNNTLTLHQPYIKQIARIGIPMYNVMGNHDMNFDVKEDHLSDETFEANFGPANYAFNYGNAHFIVLDDILYPDPRDGNGYWGGLRQDQLDFVENNLKHVPHDKLVVIALHIPLYDEDFDPDGTFRKADRARLFSLLKDYPHTLSLSAHTHLQRQFLHDADNGWLRDEPHHEYNVGTTSGDWYSGEHNDQGIPVSTMRDGTRKGYAFLQVNGNAYQLDYKVAGEPATHQIGVFAPKVVAKGRGRAAAIYANFYMGHEHDTVQYRIDDGEWQAMTFTPVPDPAYVYAVGRYDLLDTLLTGRRPSNPQPSSHLWQAPLPATLEVGEHTIEVRATDRFGRTHTGTRTYRIAERK